MAYRRGAVTQRAASFGCQVPHARTGTVTHAATAHRAAPASAEAAGAEHRHLEKLRSSFNAVTSLPEQSPPSAAKQQHKHRLRHAQQDGSLDNTGQITAETLSDACSIFNSFVEEHEYWVDDAWVDGQIPAELEGTFFRNGPGLQINNKQQQRHTFDGDGMVLSLAFQDGRAFFRNRYVRTKGFCDEQVAGKPLYRNTFTKGAADGSRWFNPLDLKFKNVANTNVLHWAGKLYALWEAGKPHLLDPATLATTERESNLDGAIGNVLAGHYRIMSEADGSTRWVTFGTGVSLSGSNLTFYEFDQTGKRLHASTHPLKGVDLSFVHDFIVTENYYVVVMGPICFDVPRFVTQYAVGRCTIADCLRYDEALATKVFLFPRPGRPMGNTSAVEVQPRVLTTKPFFSFHHVNAYEADEGRRVIIDTIAWDEVDFKINQYTVNQEYYTGGCRSELHRLDCDLQSGQVHAERLVRRTAEFPAYNPQYNGKQYQYSYLVADTVNEDVLWGPGQAIMKVSVPAVKGAVLSSAHHPLANAPVLSAPATSATVTATAAAGPRHQGGSAATVQESAHAVAKTATSALAAGVSTELWFAGARRFPGEPVFIPRLKIKQHGISSSTLPAANSISECGCTSAASTVKSADAIQRHSSTLNSISSIAQSGAANMACGCGCGGVVGARGQQLTNPAVSRPHSRVSSVGSLQGAQTGASIPLSHHLVTGSATRWPQAPTTGSRGSGEGVQASTAAEDAITALQQARTVSGTDGVEDDGWLISVCHNAEVNRAEILILDAQAISAGPVATIRLPHHLPAGLHGSFSSVYTGPDPATAASFVRRPPNLIRQL